MTNEEVLRYNELLQSVLNVDCETNGLEETAEILEIAVGFTTSLGQFQTNSKLFSVSNIPPESSAVNNITASTVDGCDTFAESIGFVDSLLTTDKFYVAHNAEFELKVLGYNLTKAGALGSRALNKNNWICTMRLAKHLFATEEKMQYSQQYLRYFLALSVADHIYPHRATNDVIVNYELIKSLAHLAWMMKVIDGTKPWAEQLRDLCWKSIPITRWPVRGKNYGKLLTEIPTDYYEWALREITRLKEDSPDYDADLADALASVLGERLGV